MAVDSILAKVTPLLQIATKLIGEQNLDFTK